MPFAIYMNTLITDWKKLPISRNYSLDTLLYADNLVLLENAQADLQITVHDLNKITRNYGMEISMYNTKIFTFSRKSPPDLAKFV